MNTSERLEQLLIQNLSALSSYKSTVRMFKGLNCGTSEQMIEMEREELINNMIELKSFIDKIGTHSVIVCQTESCVTICEEVFINK